MNRKAVLEAHPGAQVSGNEDFGFDVHRAGKHVAAYRKNGGGAWVEESKALGCEPEGDPSQKIFNNPSSHPRDDKKSAPAK